MAVFSSKVKHAINGKLFSYSRGLLDTWVFNRLTYPWLFLTLTTNNMHFQWKKSSTVVSLLVAALSWTIILAPSVLRAKVALTFGRKTEKKGHGEK